MKKTLINDFHFRESKTNKMASINTKEAFAEKICIVRSKLNKEKIKLWLPPFTSENGEKGDVPMVCTFIF